MFKRTLPVGSVVSLYGGEKRLMILGYVKYLKDDESGKVYDYCGCTYPEGYVGSEATAVFDHDDIEHIYALGFQDEVQFEFRSKLEKILEEQDEADAPDEDETEFWDEE